MHDVCASFVWVDQDIYDMFQNPGWGGMQPEQHIHRIKIDWWYDCDHTLTKGSKKLQ